MQMETIVAEKPALSPVDRAPRAPGLPVVGNTLQMLQDPLRYLVQQYRTLGPVFHLKMGFKDYVVVAGIEANKMLAAKEDEHFRSDTLFGSFQEHLNTDIMMTALDGHEHRYMRSLLRPGFSRSAAGHRIDEMIDTVAQRRQQWGQGDLIEVLDHSRRIIVDQIGIVTANHPPGEYFDDIRIFINAGLNIEVLKTLPKISWQLPKIRRASNRVKEFGQQLLAWHMANPPEATGREPDLIDAVLQNPRPDGEPFTDDDLQMLAYSPYFAGMDTVASTFSYLLYAVASDPDIYQRAQDEVDQAFADGYPTMTAFRNMPIMHAIAIETLRRYPATPFTPRSVRKAVEFQGYEIPAGTELMFAGTVTHFLEEYYPDPYTFDIDRHLGEENSRIPNVFVPYAVGKHSCLGAGFAEVQLMVSLAAMLHFYDFELETPDFEPKIYTMPLPNPGNEFKLRITKIRH